MTGDAQRELVVLLRRASGGDRTAFADLYRRTAAKLLGTIRRIIPQQGMAEEVVQEAFVKIWERASDYDPAIASPVAWMTTVARHAAIDTLRKGAERVSAAGTEIDPDAFGFLVDPSADAERLDAGRGLGRCLGALDEGRRNMVVLAYCHGWSREELARRYDRPVATVKTLLRRSLIALKECLGGGR